VSSDPFGLSSWRISAITRGIQSLLTLAYARFTPQLSVVKWRAPKERY